MGSSSGSTNVTAHLTASRRHLLEREPLKALNFAKRAEALSPDDPNVLLHLARCLITVGQRRSTRSIIERLDERSLENAEPFDALGTLLTLCGLPARALSWHERAVTLAPENDHFAFNCAAVRRMNGDLVGAEKLLDALIARRGDDVRSHYLRSDLRPQTSALNHISELLELQKRGLPSVDGQIMVGFALAKELEDVRNHDASIVELKRAAGLQRRRMKYAVEDDIEVLQRLIDRHPGPPSNVDDGLGAGCTFVMGLPRSGTTLVERFLTHRTGVVAGGELPDFAEACVGAVTSGFGRVPKSEFVDRLLDCDPAEIGRCYLSSAREHLGGAGRFVDKSPGNYLYAGVIRRALPSARIVVVAREPMDACYAMFKTLFPNAYPFSYDLVDLGRYYVAWHRLIRHWQAQLADALLTIQYERLVSDTAGSVKRLYAHCNLAWDEQVLHIEDNRAAVATASATQVVRPVYSSSVGRWRHYERALTPLLQVLELAGIPFDSQLGV